MYLSFIIIVSGNICNIIFHVVIKEPLSKAYLERLARKNSLSAVGSAGKASVIPEAVIVCNKEDKTCFVNHALDTHASTKHQQLEVQSLPKCNGTPNMDIRKCVTNKTGDGVTSVTMDSSVTKKVGSNDVQKCNCVAEKNTSCDDDNALRIIDRSPSPCSMQKSRMEWLKSPSIYKTAVVYMCTRLVVNISQSYLPLYLTETLNFEKEAIAYFPLVALVSGVLASLLVKTLSKRLGQKITYIIGGSISIGACVWFYFQSVDMRNSVYAATVLMGSGASVMLVTSLSMIADLVGDDKKCGAFVYGAISFSDKVSSGVVIAIIQELNPRVHQVDACLKCSEYVRHVQSIAPGVAAVFGLLTVILCYNSKFICKIQVDYSDVGVQVNMDQSWLEKDNTTDLAISDKDEDSIWSNSTSECIAQIHCNHDKTLTKMDTDTRF